MKTLYMTTLASALMLLGACDDTLPSGQNTTGPEAWDTATSDTAEQRPGSPYLTQLDWSCDPATGDWNYYAQTEGWAGFITIDIFETGSSVPWEEYHDLVNVSWDEQGTWDQWDVTLRHVDGPGSVIPGQSTLFTCGYHADDSLTWMVTTYDESGEPFDCAVFGQRPSYWISDRGYRDCLNWN